MAWTIDKLLVEAKAADIPLSEFWTMTPREFWCAVEGHQVAERRRLQRESTAAYLATGWTLARKLPDFQTLMRRLSGEPEPPPQPWTPEQTRARLERLTRRYGGKDLRRGVKRVEPPKRRRKAKTKEGE